MTRFFRAFPALAVIPFCGIAGPKLTLAVLYTDVPGLDSSGRENLAAQLGRSLANDKELLVYDARTRQGPALDRVFGNPAAVLGKDLRERIHAGTIQAGLVLQCRLDSAWGFTVACRFQSMDLKGTNAGKSEQYVFLPELSRSAEWVDRIAKKFRMLLGTAPGETVADTAALRFPQPVGPARLIHDGEIIRSGMVESFPAGHVLETGSLPATVAVKVGRGYLFFFARSRYGRLPGGTPFLEEGKLGLMESGIPPEPGKTGACFHQAFGI